VLTRAFLSNETMNVEPLNLSTLLGAVMWPVTALVALAVLRKPLGDLISVIGQRLEKVSIAGASFDLKKVSELKAPSLDADLRELNAGAQPQSGPIDLLAQLRSTAGYECVVIDLGSESAPRWLTSRLYLFGLILSRIRRVKCMVFVETAAGNRNRFVGVALPEEVRWALAHRYPWLEYAYTQAYGSLGIPQFDATTGWLNDWQASNLIQQFLAIIRVGQVPTPVAIPFPDPNHTPDKIDLGNGIFEYAKWLDGGRVERLLGPNLMTSSITIPPGKDLDDMASAVLKVKDRFVAIIETDRTFRGLIDRLPSLEKMASTLAKKLPDSPTRESATRETKDEEL
jgi:hypothetical protein